MKTHYSKFAILLISSSIFPIAAAQSNPMVPANAQEQAPEALLGVWKADISASQYINTPPRKNIRSFSYTQDGKVLVTSTTLNSAGRVSMLHWAVQLDGTPAPEFTQVSRSTPASLVGLKMEDTQTFIMTVSKHGEVTLTGEMQLSEDGDTLTYRYGQPNGEQNRIVYHRWDMSE
tara:strand:+ start:96328 stop:96852 length:525 start_codon:yes stop_codon:yes gene_type:complete